MAQRSEVTTVLDPLNDLDWMRQHPRGEYSESGYRTVLDDERARRRWADISDSERQNAPGDSVLAKAGSQNLVAYSDRGGYYEQKRGGSGVWATGLGAAGIAALLTPVGWILVIGGIIALVVWLARKSNTSASSAMTETDDPAGWG